MTAEDNEGTLASASAPTAVLGRDGAEVVLSAAVYPESLGRYAVLECIGRGGMGEVLRAYDPRLQREVALKVVRADLIDPVERQRLLREARAMGRISHTNVVAVFDVLDSPVGIVLVMEYVRGQTLRAWEKAESRPWAQVVANYIAAGRGLAAAHAEGLVHRDFKPTNVLLAQPSHVGRERAGALLVKVTDFGLAKLAVVGGQRRSEDAVVVTSDDGVSMPVTRADALVGTPRYMAPEQYTDAALSPAADQYAFCVALWQALSGKAPFTGDDLYRTKIHEPPRWPADAPRVPKALVASLRRGLAAEPTARWPTMGALLDSLASASPRRRLRRGALALAGLATFGVIGQRIGAGEATAPCQDASQHLDGVWDEARGAAVEAAFSPELVGFAPDVWKRQHPRMDAWAQDWIAMRTEACEATAVRGEQSMELLDLRMACLDRAKQGLAATADVLETADAGVVHNAHALVERLPTLDRCADVEALTAQVAPPSEEDRDAVRAIRAEIERVRALASGGRVVAASEILDGLSARVQAVSYGPVVTEFQALVGTVAPVRGDFERADQALVAVVREGPEYQQWDLVRLAATRLVSVVGASQNRPGEGLAYRALAEGLASGDPIAEADIMGAVAGVLVRQGPDGETEAELLLRGALDRLELGTRQRGTTQATLGMLLARRGERDEAGKLLLAAVDSTQAVVGPHHPGVAATKLLVAGHFLETGKLSEGESMLRAAMAIWVGVGQDEEPIYSAAEELLGQFLLAQGDHAGAEEQVRSALSRLRKQYGDKHPLLAGAMDTLGTVQRARGQLQRAEESFRLALEILEKQPGPEHPRAPEIRLHLASVLAERKQPVPSELPPADVRAGDQELERPFE